jgi:hypothetical protein
MLTKDGTMKPLNQSKINSQNEFICKLKQNKQNINHRKMKTKDFNPEESTQVFESILFTRIIKDGLKQVTLIDLMPAYMIIAHNFELEIFFDDSGYMLANNRHFKIASRILENSVMYN